MGIDEFIGEHEASVLAGVNSNTLRRYAEVGYLKPEIDSDGLRLYSKNELSSLFRISTPIEQPQNIVHFPQKSVFSSTDEEHDDSIMATTTEGNVALKPNLAPPPQPPRLDSKPLLDLQSELDRLKHMQILNDQILDMYEARIADITKERDWLRIQIDQLNERLSRDQVLLLTQTQTIAQAMAREYNKPTLVGRVMKLLGFNEEASTSSSNE